jgi:hypothetical protein
MILKILVFYPKSNVKPWEDFKQEREAKPIVHFGKILPMT